MNVRELRLFHLALAIAAAVLILAACNADPATPDAGSVCDRHDALAKMRAAMPHEQYALYFTGRPEPSGELVYGLTLWYVDAEIPLQGQDGDVVSTTQAAVARAAPVIDDVLAADACVEELFDVLLLGIVDAGYNSWYAGNVAVADLLSGASADALLAASEVMAPQTWPDGTGAAPDGSCTWAEATESLDACAQENGGCLLALVEQMGPVAVVQTRLPVAREAWKPDRDADMSLADAVEGALGCVYPAPYTKVVNIVDEEGKLLFAGEFSRQAEQLTYYVPLDDGATADGEGARALQTQQEPVPLPTPFVDPVVLRELAERLDDPTAELLVYMLQGDNRMEIAVTDFAGGVASHYPIVQGDGVPIQPMWSPDRQRIFFYYLPNPSMNLVSLWVVDLAQQAARSVSESSLAAYAEFTWSPDGTYIAYPGGLPGEMTTDIYRVDAVSGENIKLTDSAGEEHGPAWSPDGASIVYVSDSEEPGVDSLWLMAADGGGARRLTTAGPLLDVLPAWSPDGSEIAFFRRGTDPDRTRANGVWAIRPDGSGERLIVASTDESLLEPVDTLWPPQAPPVWSPDGESIAYMQRTPEGETDVYVVSASGGEPVLVSDLPGIEYAAAWTPRGDALTFTHMGYDGVYGIYVVRPDGSDLRALFGDALPQSWAQNAMVGEWAAR